LFCFALPGLQLVLIGIHELSEHKFIETAQQNSCAVLVMIETVQIVTAAVFFIVLF